VPKMPSRKLRRKKGIVGIESAIVMIAFVIVAAALAFVVLNMGFFTTQQSRAAIQRGLGEASSALELDGTVVAHVDTNNQNIDYWFATLKLSSGQHQVDLTPVKAVLSYWSPQKGVAIANTYLIAVTTPIYDPEILVNITEELLTNTTRTISGDKGDVVTLYLNYSSTNGVENIAESATSYDYVVKIGLPDDVDNMNLKNFFENFSGGVVSAVAWITKTNEDTVLDPGEKVMLLVYYKASSYKPTSYDIIKAEFKVPIGAPLTIERTVPPSLTQEIVDLG